MVLLVLRDTAASASAAAGMLEDVAVAVVVSPDIGPDDDDADGTAQVCPWVRGRQASTL